MTGRIWVCENCGAENPTEAHDCHDCGWDKFTDSEDDSPDDGQDKNW
jgi:predicted ATP-dependent serine protease